MYNEEIINKLILFIQSKDGIANKDMLTEQTKIIFNLTKDRSVYYCSDFAVRFCKATTKNFSNTVLSLSALQKYDDKPFIVCLEWQELDNRLRRLHTVFFLQQI